MSNSLELCPDQPGGSNKDPTVWLDGARPHPKYVFKNNEFDELKKMTNLDPTK